MISDKNKKSRKKKIKENNNKINNLKIENKIKKNNKGNNLKIENKKVKKTKSKKKVDDKDNKKEVSLNKNNDSLFLYEFYSWVSPYKQILLNIVSNNKNKNNRNLENLNEIFFNIYKKVDENKEIRKSYMEINLDKYEDLTKTIAALRSGLTYYVRNTTKIDHISNAYIKIWEILRVFNFKWKKRNEFNAFHFTELPGGFINCLTDMSKKLNKKYDWKAQSLHPDLGGFGNSYNIMKKYPGRHDFGPLSTGDIIDTNNIQYYYDKNMVYKPILVTSDAGAKGENIDYFLLQKLEIAQAFNVISSVDIGGDVIVKHFTPYLSSEKISNKGFTTFIDMLYYYYLNFKTVYCYKPMASNETSGEFYVIGLNKLKITDQVEIDRLKNIISNHKVNERLFDNKIEINFILQIYNLLYNMNNYNEKTINTINKIFKMDDKDIEFIKNNMNNFNKQKYKAWMNEFWIY